MDQVTYKRYKVLGVTDKHTPGPFVVRSREVRFASGVYSHDEQNIVCMTTGRLVRRAVQPALVHSICAQLNRFAKATGGAA